MGSTKDIIKKHRIVSVEQAVRVTGLSYQQVHKYSQRGVIGAKVGRNYIYAMSELIEFSRQERKPGPKPRPPIR